MKILDYINSVISTTPRDIYRFVLAAKKNHLMMLDPGDLCAIDDEFPVSEGVAVVYNGRGGETKREVIDAFVAYLKVEGYVDWE